MAAVIPAPLNSLASKPTTHGVSPLTPSLPAVSTTFPQARPPRSEKACLRTNPLPRPAWIEINLTRFRGNFEAINRDKPPGLKLLSVIKDEAYGHGAIEAAKVAAAAGVEFFALGTVEEAIVLREHGFRQSLLLLGDCSEEELPWCVHYGLTCCVAEARTIVRLGQLAAQADKRLPVHLKVNTGMNRYGVHWREATSLAGLIGNTKSLALEGILSHFAQSDEADRTFALVQLGRFQEAVAAIAACGIPIPIRHICNSGGFLDLPQAHFEMVRLGLLAFGVFPEALAGNAGRQIDLTMRSGGMRVTNWPENGLSGSSPRCRQNAR